MGLDFSHCEASWSYGGFARFRRRIATTVGLAGFENITRTDDPAFEQIKDDPILPLLAHSDCEGFLSVEDCKRVAPRLRELVASWKDDDYDKKTALKLAKGMDDAAEAGEPLEFQ